MHIGVFGSKSWPKRKKINLLFKPCIICHCAHKGQMHNVMANLDSFSLFSKIASCQSVTYLCAVKLQSKTAKIDQIFSFFLSELLTIIIMDLQERGMNKMFSLNSKLKSSLNFV